MKNCLLFLTLLLSISGLKGQTPYKPDTAFINGGQFKDLFLPMPINGKLTKKSIWGGDNVLPRDIKNGIEDNEWCYWGGNPILGKDGKYHIAIARWPEKTGHWGWPKSEVAHAVSKNVIGPYKVTATSIEEGHNPEVLALQDGGYILHLSKARVYRSDELGTPWTPMGTLSIDTKEYKGLSHLNTNLSGLEREDGSFLFFTKRGDVIISNKGILGPFEMVSAHNYIRYSGYPEDPVIWKSRHQYHVVYNHAVEKKSVHMRSLDGINWIIEPGLAYDQSIFKYTDGTQNKWVKFERPKVVQDQYGRATHMSLAVIDVEKKEDLGNDIHSSKHLVLPLLVERLIELEDYKLGKTLTLRIKAEQGFVPSEDVDLNSLSIGASNIVNYGRGGKVLRSQKDGNDLLISFDIASLNINPMYYDLKLIGKNTGGELLYGYALLPNFSDNPPSLVSEPITFNDESLMTKIKNYGLKSSQPCQVKIIARQDARESTLKTYNIPELSPYASFDIQLKVEKENTTAYEVIIVDEKSNSQPWHKVDDAHYSICYKGEWKTNNKGKNIYMNSERVASKKGDAVTYSFYGTQAKCFGNISRLMGGCEVYIDGAYIENIDSYFGADIHNTVIYQTPVMELGLHKLELRLTGLHYKGKDKAPIAIDAFSYR